MIRVMPYLPAVLGILWSQAPAMAFAQPAPPVAVSAPDGPTASGSYLNLQPRPRTPRRPLFTVAGAVAPQREPAEGARAARRLDDRTVVCGMTVLRGAPATDPGMIVPIPRSGPRPTIRAVDPPVCVQPEPNR